MNLNKPESKDKERFIVWFAVWWGLTFLFRGFMYETPTTGTEWFLDWLFFFILYYKFVR